MVVPIRVTNIAFDRRTGGALFVGSFERSSNVFTNNEIRQKFGNIWEIKKQFFFSGKKFKEQLIKNVKKEVWNKFDKHIYII